MNISMETAVPSHNLVRPLLEIFFFPFSIIGATFKNFDNYGQQYGRSMIMILFEAWLKDLGSLT